MIDYIIVFINLTLLEIVLGIDNILFISILADKLPVEIQEKARKLGLLGALVTRIILLASIKFIMNLGGDWLHFYKWSFSTRDLILLAGGLFLLFKASNEIYHFVEAKDHGKEANKASVKSFASFLIQVALVDIVFSIDSVITAIGLSDNLTIMVLAIVTSIFIMMFFSTPLNEFIKKHAALRILALSFLIVVGVVLIADGFGEHVPRGYIYFGMGFTIFVEILNIRRQGKIKKTTI